MHSIVALPTKAPAMSEDTTLIAAGRTDPTAFGALYHRYRDRIYAYLRARSSRDEDAADLCPGWLAHPWVKAMDRAVDTAPGHRASALVVAPLSERMT